MHCQSARSAPSLPSLHRLSLRAASTAAPGEYPPNLRDIVELELLLRRLFELKETDENDAVILSDEDQLRRMLFSLQVLYAEVADDPRPPGGPPMTDQDVNTLTDIVFELGAAREAADRTGRSFFLTTGAYRACWRCWSSWRRGHEALRPAPTPTSASKTVSTARRRSGGSARRRRGGSARRRSGGGARRNARESG